MSIPNIETASLAQIKRYQEQELQKLLRYLQAHSPYYQQLFTTNDISIANILTLEDLTKLPVTTKDALQRHNMDFLCVPKEDVVDFVTTSGTLGDPVTFALTDEDLNRLAYNEAISFACSGVTKNDVLQLMTTIDRRFMAGMAYYLGARELGAGVIRVGSGVPELQWDTIQKFRPTYLVCVPSFLLKLIEYANSHGISLEDSGVKAAICIGEPIREANFQYNTLATKITEAWNIQLFSTYASTEMSTAFNECEAHQGGHHHPELIIVEVLDDNNIPVPIGEVGELTITTLGVTAMPLLRFKTGDMVQAFDAPCSCGRNTLRLGPVVGRKQQMIKYKGTTLYPPAMFNVMHHFEEVQTFIIEIDQNDIGTDEITLKIACDAPTEAFQNEIKDHFRAKLRVTPTIVVEEAAVIDAVRFPKLSRKPRNIIDKRR